MNIETWIASIFAITHGAVLTIEAVHGEKVAGADKKTMAQTALAGAIATATGFFTGQGNAGDAALTQAIGGMVSAGINLFATPMNPAYAAARSASLNLPAATEPTAS